MAMGIKHTKIAKIIPANNPKSEEFHSTKRRKDLLRRVFQTYGLLIYKNG